MLLNSQTGLYARHRCSEPPEYIRYPLIGIMHKASGSYCSGRKSNAALEKASSHALLTDLSIHDTDTAMHLSSRPCLTAQGPQLKGFVSKLVTGVTFKAGSFKPNRRPKTTGCALLESALCSWLTAILNKVVMQHLSKQRNAPFTAESCNCNGVKTLAYIQIALVAAQEGHATGCAAAATIPL